MDLYYQNKQKHKHFVIVKIMISHTHNGTSSPPPRADMTDQAWTLVNMAGDNSIDRWWEATTHNEDSSQPHQLNA